MQKVAQLFLISITIIVFTACAGPQELSTNPGAMQGDWQLTAMNGNSVSSNAGYTLSFNTDNTIAGLAGCNYVVGEYSASEGGTVTLSSVAGTDIDCESQPMDSNYISAVEAVGSFEVREGNTLVLTDGGSTELTFSKVMPEEG